MLIRRTAPLASLACVLVTSCAKPKPVDTSKTCTCAVYPFAQQCTSVCKLTEYVVQSVNQKNIVAKAAQPGGAHAPEERTIPISNLSPKQVQGLEPGARLQVLSKVENGQSVIMSLHLANKPASK